MPAAAINSFPGLPRLCTDGPTDKQSDRHENRKVTIGPAGRAVHAWLVKMGVALTQRWVLTWEITIIMWITFILPPPLQAEEGIHCCTSSNGVNVQGLLEDGP